VLYTTELAVTYPGVQAVDDSTLLCTCGAKVKLGRARMLHNYSNCKTSISYSKLMAQTHFVTFFRLLL